MLTREYTQEQRDELQTFAIELLYKLYTNEMKYTEYLYDEIGWTADVKAFVRYNLNKALANLGMDAIYPERAQDVNPIVMTGLSTESSNHDFFSQVGNSYIMGKVQSVSTEDYDLVNALATRRTQNKTDDRSEQ